MAVDIPQTENEDLAVQALETGGLAPEAVDPSPEVDPNRTPEAEPVPEKETDEQWILRFLEENQHLARPRPERPPAPPPSPWDGPPSTWKVPDHLSLRHPKGGYMAMALMSRTMDDLDEVTKGERAATYEEVDKYLGHALIAEGLVPFTYTADEAIRWWKAGGYQVLGTQADDIRSFEMGTIDDSVYGLELPCRFGDPGNDVIADRSGANEWPRPLWPRENFTADRDRPPLGEGSDNLSPLTVSPAVFNRSAPGLYSSGDDTAPDAALVQANYRSGRLGRGPFGGGSASRRAFIESLPPIQYLRANAYDHATRQIAQLNPQASYTIEAPGFVPTWEQVRQRNEELITVRQTTVDNITRHAFDSHILGSRPAGSRPYSRAIREMPEVRTVAQFKSLIYEAISRPTYVKSLSNGRTAFWYDRASLLVVVNTRSPSKSTAFQPGPGVSYFNAMN